jgi:hypothetical protein
VAEIGEAARNKDIASSDVVFAGVIPVVIVSQLLVVRGARRVLAKGAIDVIAAGFQRPVRSGLRDLGLEAWVSEVTGYGKLLGDLHQVDHPFLAYRVAAE